MALVFDIETIGQDFDSLPPSVQEFLLRPAGGKEEEEAEIRKRNALLPFTGEVVCIAMHNTEKNAGGVFYRNRSAGDPEPAADAGVACAYTRFDSEKELLAAFWERIQKGPIDDRPYVTFNGRGFDVPFLCIRSGIRSVRVTKDLLGNRYKSDTHVDLLDWLKFQGAFWGRFNLDMACRAFGIESPKSEEAHGHMVSEMWVAGRGADIARYCYGDVVATGQLYQRWRDFMKV